MVFLRKKLNEKERYQIRSFRRTRFFTIGILSFLIFRFATIRYVDIAIAPANVKTRSNLFRSGEFELLLAFLIVTPANQSIVWPTEEKYVPEFKLSLFEYSKQKASPAEITDEPIKASIKYVKRKIFNRFSPFLRTIVKLYQRINIYTSIF